MHSYTLAVCVYVHCYTSTFCLTCPCLQAFSVGTKKCKKSQLWKGRPSPRSLVALLIMQHGECAR